MSVFLMAALFRDAPLGQLARMALGSKILKFPAAEHFAFEMLLSPSKHEAAYQFSPEVHHFQPKHLDFVVSWVWLIRAGLVMSLDLVSQVQ